MFCVSGLAFPGSLNACSKLRRPQRVESGPAVSYRPRMPSTIQKALILVAEGLKARHWDNRLFPPTPPLLRGARTGGGWWNGGCPYPGDTVEPTSQMTGEATSPDLSERLARRFPPGSDAAALEQALLEAGLQPGRTCEKHSIRSAEFRQEGGGFFGPYPMDATVAWKIMSDGRVLWTKGRVLYRAP